jgi:hypothetical protein
MDGQSTWSESTVVGRDGRERYVLEGKNSWTAKLPLSRQKELADL